MRVVRYGTAVYLSILISFFWSWQEWEDWSLSTPCFHAEEFRPWYAPAGAGLSLLIAPGVRSGAGQVMAFSTFDMVESLIREVILGLVIGCVFHIFFYMLYVAGDFLDTVFGLAMGKVMDGRRSPDLYSGPVCQRVFLPLFFCQGCHLTMVRLFAYSYQVVPVGAGAILGGRILWYIITLFGSVFLMVIKLVLPFVAAEFILEMTMGVLMKLIPQIHVFVINIQCKSSWESC